MRDTHDERPCRSASCGGLPRVVGLAAALAIAAALIGAAIWLRGNRAIADDPAPPRENPLRSGSNSNDAKAPSTTQPVPTPATGQPAAESAPASPAGAHPLDPAISMAEKVLAHIQKDVKDYTCVMVKQERIDGKLKDAEYMQTKFRREPFSVYMRFLKPDDIKGREVLYVAGANDGKMLVREPSGLRRMLGAIPLKPDSPLAMEGQRYPITDFGLEHLTKRLIEIAKHDRKYGEVEVHFFKEAKVNDRVCTLIEVVHPTQQTAFLFHKARIYIDDQLNLPIRYEAYLWPKKPGDDPPLDESYSYLKLKVNVDLKDIDFDVKNPKYHFVGP